MNPDPLSRNSNEAKDDYFNNENLKFADSPNNIICENKKVYDEILTQNCLFENIVDEPDDNNVQLDKSGYSNKESAVESALFELIIKLTAKNIITELDLSEETMNTISKFRVDC